ncbi:MAG: peptide ABC transporter substrate-binding protein [Culicoidibacterales bacterium]
MKKMMKIGIGMIALVLVLAACNGGIKSEKGVLRLAVPAPSNSLNGMLTSEAVNFEILENITEGLTRKTMSGKIEPAIAQDWTISADNTEYTFNLRKTKWSNGEPVTARDFVFAWGKVLMLEKSSYSDLAQLLKNGKAIKAGAQPLENLGVKAEGDYTLKMTLEIPTPYMLDLMSSVIFNPVNEAFYNQIGAENYGTTGDTILTNGAFTLASYAADTGYAFKKNTDYWDQQAVKLSDVFVRVVTTLDTQAVMYDNNELDRLVLTDSLIDRYEGKDGIETQTENRTQYMYLSGTTGTPSKLLSNKNFRMAVAYAVDKQLIADTILKDGSIPSDYLIPQGFVQLNGTDFREKSKLFNSLYFDPVKARNFLEEAKKELGSEPLTFVLNSVDSEPQKKVFQNVTAQIEANLPGVKVQFETQPRQSYFKTLFEFKTPAAYSGWGADYADPTSFFAQFKSTSSLNFAQYNNPAFDKAITETESAELGRNPEQRWNKFIEAEKIFIEDFVVIPLYQKGNKIIVKNGYENLTYDTGQPVRHFRLVTQK